ncbi:MAG: restriction endonuclease subunit S [Planctomycetes bacterium]|nr:restriction endonuclease subunit S [Planctomycetota bacterium]
METAMARSSALAKPEPRILPALADENGDLPEGWAYCAIADIFDSWGGLTPSTSNAAYWGGKIPWVSSKDVKQWRITAGTEFLKPSALEAARLRLCPKSSVLVVMRSGILRHTLPVAVLDAEVTINQDIKAFYCAEHRLNEWLALALRALEQQILNTNRKDGTTVQSIEYDQLKALEVKFPPIAEQKRIVAKVEALLARVNAARERLAKVPPILKRFRQAVLAAACSGRLTEDWRATATVEEVAAAKPANPKIAVQVEEIIETPGYWKWQPLEAVCNPTRAICYGVIKLGAPHVGGIPCLRTSDVKPLHIDTVDVKQISPEISSEFKRTLLSGGEILVSVRGTLGGVAVVPSELRGWNISREVAMVPITGVEPKFVAFWIASITCQNWLTDVVKGVAYSGINIEDLRLLPVALPSLAEQREIVRRVEKLFKLADAIEKRVAAATLRADRLTQAILAKAFRGELVPTEAALARRENRPYEPASELLKRIQSARAAPQEPKPKRARQKNA